VTDLVASERAISFGPFRLVPGQRLLLEGDKPVRLGSRALDILIVLVEHSGEVVGKDELIARVWPGTFVEEGNLKFQVGGLRRALGDGHAGNRYIATVPGRGYSFVAPVRFALEPQPSAPQVSATARQHNLPALLTRLVGRAETVGRLTAQLPRQRLLTIVGPGGIGKTSVALAVAERLIGIYEQGVWLIDLAPLGDPLLMPSAVASVIGWEVRSYDPIRGLIAFLRDKKMLLVLDSCEHLVEAVAAFVGQLLRGASGVHILATSREPLRVEGEQLHRLSPLACPSLSAPLTTTEALRFPAVQLFVERVAASLEEFELSDADAPIVADICCRLDGIALAIELAAARVGAFGVRGLAAHLDDRFGLLTRGRRMALPRHQTLRAMPDWSYDMLPETERVILRRLAVFLGGFTMEAASAVATSAEIAEPDVVDCVANLVTKSLVMADVGGALVRFRLLDTTHAYALEKLGENGEREALGRRHAEYYRDLLEAAAQDKTAADDWPAGYVREIDNLRTALAWAFAAGGDLSVGAALAAASAPVWLEMSLLTECHGWTGAAIASLAAADRGTRREMALQTAFAISLMYTMGMTSKAHAALVRAVELAKSLHDPEYQLRALTGLCTFRIRFADFRKALAFARQCEAAAEGLADPAAMPTADWMLGVSLYFLGEQAAARAHFERALDAPLPASPRAYIVRFGVDQRVHSLSILAHILWLQGFPDQAVRTGKRGIDLAYTLEHPVSMCMALTWGGSTIALRTGDLTVAERYTGMLIEHAEKHSVSLYHAYGLGVRGWLSAKHGDPVKGVLLLRAALAGIRETRSYVFYMKFLVNLAEFLGSAGEVDAGLAAIDEALQRAERHEELWCMPEVLRIKGELLLLVGAPDAEVAAADHFVQALDWARRLETLSWELRAAISLARVQGNQGRILEARDLLAPIYERFTEGFGTADLREAKRLIDALP
jgi:predicted ATPase/DNA-binding winged helix-turn-helix (wHTH) protein